MITLRDNLKVKVFRNGQGSYISDPPGRYGRDVYWKIGQSNQIGRAAIRAGIDDNYTAVAGKVFQYGYNSQTVSPATNPLDHVNENPGQMGMWLEEAKALLPTVVGERTILFAPCAQGGTSFSGNNWNPGNTLNNNAKARVNAAMALPGGQNRLVAVTCLLGESDSDAGVTAANLFRTRIQAMYDNFLTTVTGMTATTPFVVGTIKPDKPRASIINAALLDFANSNAAVRFVDLTDLSWFDSDHYDAPSLAIAGKRYAQAIMGTT